MKNIKLFLAFALILPIAIGLISAYQLCYQEATNQSFITDGSCPLNYSGFGTTRGFEYDIGTGNENDGNWNTGASCSLWDSEPADWQEFYAYPENRNELLGVIVQFKTDTGIHNVTLLKGHSCIDPSVPYLKLGSWGNCFKESIMYDPMSIACEDNNTMQGLYYSDPNCVGECSWIEYPDPPPDGFWECPYSCWQGTIYEMGVYWLYADLVPPIISLDYPTNTTYSDNITELNYSIINATDCWYSLDDGITNTSITCGNNVIGLSSGYGSFTWSIYANNSDGEILDSITFFVEEPEVIPQEPEEVAEFTEQGQAIYSIMSSSGAGLGIFMNFMGQALSPLLIILGLIGVVVVIAYFIISSIKIKPLGVR